MFGFFGSSEDVETQLRRKGVPYSKTEVRDGVPVKEYIEPSQIGEKFPIVAPKGHGKAVKFDRA